MACIIEKHFGVDATLDQMLKSYQKSVNDPDDELVHLYEIRDCLSKKFGSKKNAISNLRINEKEWDEIGKIANNLPLNQGRHRGKFVGNLRNAENAELEKARKSIVCLIEKYLDYLET